MWGVLIMIQHMLVPLDLSAPSLQALDYAIALAEKFQARVTLLHVLTTPALAGGLEMESGTALVAYMDQLETDARQAMEYHAQRVRMAGLACDAEVLPGVPFQRIIDLAGERQADLVVIGTHGHTGLQRFLLGSVAEKVVRLAPCPVLVTRTAVSAAE
jgi:nucleotide-binding universal stress UspA family protein